MTRPRAYRTIENALRRFGFVRIAGVDEVGRGCLAGPVMAGAVVLDPDRHIAGLRDSKMLSAAQRERLYDQIIQHALGWSVAAVEPAGNRPLNIHRASLQAMRQAVLALVPLPDLVLVDAFRIPDLPIAQRGVVHGDARCSADRGRFDRCQGHPGQADARSCTTTDSRYGFDRHKGYGTPEHLRAVARFGYSAAHRRSFRPPSLFDVLGSPLRDLRKTPGAADKEAGSARYGGHRPRHDAAESREAPAPGSARPGDRRVPEGHPGPAPRLEHHQHGGRPVRARRPARERGVEHFTRIADHLFEEGFFRARPPSTRRS